MKTIHLFMGAFLDGNRSFSPCGERVVALNAQTKAAESTEHFRYVTCEACLSKVRALSDAFVACHGPVRQVKD